MTRKQMIQFIAMVQQKAYDDIELYFIDKPDEFIKPLFDKMKEQRDAKTDEFVAA